MSQPTAVIGSLGLHAALIAALSIGLPLARDLDRYDVPQVIAIDLVAIGEETIVQSQLQPEPAPEPPAPAPQKPAEPAPEEAPPEPVAKEEAPPAPPKPEPVVKPKEAVPEEMAKEEPEPEPEEKVNEDEALADFAQLIDRSKEDSATSEDLEDELFAAFGKERVASSDSREQAISLEDSARSQVAKCWNLPLGGKGVAQMRVTVTVLLGPDGAVVGTPTLDPSDQRRMNRPDETVFNAFALSALRAVRRCAPYELPRERYKEWQSLRLNFDPSQMLQ